MITIPATQFARTLNEVHRFATPDTTLPALHCVCFEIFADRLILIANDRFRLLAGTVPVAGEGGQGIDNTSIHRQTPETFTVDLDDCKALLKTMRSHKLTNQHCRAEITIKHTGGHAQFQIRDSHEIIGDYTEGQSAFPKWRSFLTGLENHTYTAISGAQVDGRPDLVIHAQTDAPRRRSLVTAAPNTGMNLVGIVMPMLTTEHFCVQDLLFNVGAVDEPAAPATASEATPPAA